MQAPRLDAQARADDWSGPLAELPALAWARALPDPVLGTLVPLALAHNRDLRVAQANLALVRAQADLRAAERWPSLNASVSGSRTPTSAGGIASAYTAGVGITAYELDLFGRLQASADQAQANALASLEGALSARLSLIAGVAQAWATLLADTDAAHLSAQAVQTRQDSLRLLTRRADVGLASGLDVQSAQSAVAAAQAAWVAQQRTLAADRRALEQLIGQPLPAAALGALQPGALARLDVADLPAGLPAALLQRRPDLRQAEANLLAANANVQAVRAAVWPRITLTAAAGTASSALANLASAGTWGWTLAPSAVLPLLDAGRSAANTEAARAARAVALAQYERAVQTAVREVADLLYARTSLTEQAQAQHALLQAETARHTLITQRLQHGVANQLEWLDAQRSLLAAQQAELALRLAQVVNRIALFKALGGAAP